MRNYLAHDHFLCLNKRAAFSVDSLLYVLLVGTGQVVGPMIQAQLESITPTVRV